MKFGGLNSKITEDMMVTVGVLLLVFGFLLYHKVGELEQSIVLSQNAGVLQD